MQQNEKAIINDNQEFITSLLKDNDLKVSNFSKAQLAAYANFLSTELCREVVSKAISDYKNNRNTDLDSATYEKVCAKLKSHGMCGYTDATRTKLSDDPTTFRLGKFAKCLINQVKGMDTFEELMELSCRAWCYHFNRNAMLSFVRAMCEARNNANSNDNGNVGQA